MANNDNATTMCSELPTRLIRTIGVIANGGLDSAKMRAFTDDMGGEGEVWASVMALITLGLATAEIVTVEGDPENDPIVGVTLTTTGLFVGKHFFDKMQAEKAMGGGA